MIGVAVIASKDHHPATAPVQPVPRPVPPKVTIMHQAAPFHFPLTGTQIVWIVVALGVCYLGGRALKAVFS
jgi:hypothetical protein